MRDSRRNQVVDGRQKRPRGVETMSLFPLHLTKQEGGKKC